MKLEKKLEYLENLVRKVLRDEMKLSSTYIQQSSKDFVSDIVMYFLNKNLNFERDVKISYNFVKTFIRRHFDFRTIYVGTFDIDIEDDDDEKMIVPIQCIKSVYMSYSSNDYDYNEDSEEKIKKMKELIVSFDPNIIEGKYVPKKTIDTVKQMVIMFFELVLMKKEVNFKNKWTNRYMIIPSIIEDIYETDIELFKKIYNSFRIVSIDDVIKLIKKNKQKRLESGTMYNNWDGNTYRCLKLIIDYLFCSRKEDKLNEFSFNYS